MDDSVFYRDGVNTRFRMSLLIAARQNMYQLFMSTLSPQETTRIVDIGVTGEENEGSNFLAKSYPYSENLTLAGLSDGDDIRRLYPKARYVKIQAGERLPFRDQEFDIACSNAVIEHVGGEEARRHFIEEHLRIARHVFISAPNRWFPVEHHTAIPFLHYSKSLFRSFVKKTGRAYWADPVNLELLDASMMRREWPSSSRPNLTVKMCGLPLGPFSSNFAMIVKRAD